MRDYYIIEPLRAHQSSVHRVRSRVPLLPLPWKHKLWNRITDPLDTGTGIASPKIFSTSTSEAMLLYSSRRPANSPW
eukprot:COSAG05_NODE_535_length_8871_cov_311.345759_3_plen_77_part_00